jgi:glucose 1-dehydrogenase
MECTAAPALIRDILGRTAPTGIVCLTGVSHSGHVLDVDVSRINRTLVLDNQVVFGTVNANRRHYELAADALAHADRKWLAGLITRRVPLEHWSEALEHSPDDVKVVVEFPQT